MEKEEEDSNMGLPAPARRYHTCIVWPYSGHRHLSPRYPRRWITCDENARRLQLSLGPKPCNSESITILLGLRNREQVNQTTRTREPEN